MSVACFSEARRDQREILFTLRCGGLRRDLSAYANNVALRQADTLEERFPGHQIIALLVGGRNAPLIAERNLHLAPEKVSAKRGELLVNETRCISAGQPQAEQTAFRDRRPSVVENEAGGIPRKIRGSDDLGHHHVMNRQGIENSRRAPPGTNEVTSRRIN